MNTSTLRNQNDNFFLQIDNTEFKNLICPLENVKHNKKNCYFFHQLYDKKRSLRDVKYENTLCKNENKNCENGDDCKKCHNKIELFYHPKNYKTKYCVDFLSKNKKCDFGDYCSFAHSKKELRINLLEDYEFNYDFFVFKYKTEYCPFINFKHDKNKCIYAHNIQDFRRKNMMEVIPKTCKYWDLKKKDDYESNCPKGYKCKYSHGFKEYDYHPLIFKTKPCYLGKENCKFGAICHFNHCESEKRDLKDYKPGMTFSSRNIKKINVLDISKDLESEKIVSENITDNKISLKDKLKNKFKKGSKFLIKQMSTVENLVIKQNS